MSTIEVSDALHRRLEEAAARRGQTVDVFAEAILDNLLRSLQGPPQQSLAAALATVRKQIEAEETPLLDSWSALEAEIAERRGGEYDSSS